MDVILLKDIKGTGKAGDVVKVSDGYARNMLLPKGLAQEATNTNVRILEKEKKIKADKIEEEKQAAKEMAEKLKSIKVVIETKAGEGGRIFGAITSKDIAEALDKQHGIKIDKKKIHLDSPIKAIGTKDIEIKLYSEIIGILKTEVVC